MKNIAILIPTLNPDEKILHLVTELKNLDLHNIYIVNDGSDYTCVSIFEELSDLGCKVIYHEENLGKGAALKTGIKYIRKNSEIEGIITADGDGQHLPQDIKKVAKKMLETKSITLGERQFDNPNMPLKNRIGNRISALYLKVSTGLKLTDTQTGLRAIPRKYFDFALSVPGDRYEYEMNFLEHISKEKIPLTSTEITTIYEENWTTHFHPLKDSYRIYEKFFKNIIASASSAIIDVGLFMLFIVLNVFTGTILASVFARIISGIYNFTLNKVWTFDQKNSQKTLIESRKYLILFGIQMMISALATSLLAMIFTTSTFGLFIIKIIVDIVLFIINYFVQKNWVFYNPEQEKTLTNNLSQYETSKA